MADFMDGFGSSEPVRIAASPKASTFTMGTGHSSVSTALNLDLRSYSKKVVKAEEEEPLYKIAKRPSIVSYKYAKRILLCKH